MLFSTTQNGTNIDNMVNNKIDSVIIYFRFLYYGDKGVSFFDIECKPQAEMD